MLEFAFRHSSHMSLVSCQSLSIKCQSERVEFDNLVRLPHNPIFGEIDYLVSRKVCRKSCHEKVSEYENILFVGNQIYRKSIFTSSRNRFTMSPFLPIMLPTSWKGVTSLSSLKFLFIRKKKELQYHNLLWSKCNHEVNWSEYFLVSPKNWWIYTGIDKKMLLGEKFSWCKIISSIPRKKLFHWPGGRRQMQLWEIMQWREGEREA